MRGLKVQAFAVAAAVMFASACGGDSGTDSSNVTVLNVTLNFVQGETCDNGGVAAEFVGQSGQAVTITATASSSLTPQIAVYKPDFSTLLGVSVSSGAGKATLIKTLDETGTHHITVCEVAGKAGSVKVVVTRPLAG